MVVAFELGQCNTKGLRLVRWRQQCRERFGVCGELHSKETLKPRALCLDVARWIAGSSSGGLRMEPSSMEHGPQR